MNTQSETPDDAGEPAQSSESNGDCDERTRREIEEETGGVVYTEDGRRRYRVQVISNSGDRDEPTSL